MRLKITYWALWIATIATIAFTHTGPWWEFLIIAVLVECLVVTKGRMVLMEFKERMLNLRDQSMTILRAQEKRIEELERRN